MLLNKKQLKGLINELEKDIKLIKNGFTPSVQLKITSEGLNIPKKWHNKLYKRLMNLYKHGLLTKEIKALKNNL